MKFVIFALFFATFAVGSFSAPDWNGLYVTWDANPFKGFDKVPRQLSEIGDFKLKDNGCAAGSTFHGQRYWSKQDPALFLLFDKNGYIAGIQTSELKSKYTPAPGAKGYIDDGEYWTSTAYFVDPSTICSTGRTKEEFDKQGTGTGLWLQYGPDPSKDLMSIPLKEEDVKKTLWGHGKCFVTMGKHYWYNVSVDMDCNDFYPNCLLYNGGKLNSFCFSVNANLQSPRYDNPHPTADVLSKFLDPVPKCTKTDPSFKTLSTLHVYFHSNARFESWC